MNNWGGSSLFTVEFSKQASIGEATVHKTDENVLYYEESLEKWETKTKICKNKEANIGKKNILIFRSAPFFDRRKFSSSQHYLLPESQLDHADYSDNHKVFYDPLNNKLQRRLLFRARFTQPAVFDLELE